MTHSPEPWKYIHPDDLPYGWDPVPDSASISDTETSMVVDSCKIADAERIVACVNFCAGISTDQLTAIGNITNVTGLVISK